MPATKTHYAIAMILACAFVTSSGCADSIRGADRDALVEETQHVVDTLGATVESLRETLDVQRAQLAASIERTVEIVVENLLGVVDPLQRAVEIIGVQIANLGETLTATGRAVLGAVGSLASHLQDGVQAAAAGIADSLASAEGFLRELSHCWSTEALSLL